MEPNETGTNDMDTNDMGGLRARFDAQRAAFLRDMAPDVAARRDRLDRLLALNDAHEREIVAAIDADFGHRATQETRMAETGFVATATRHAQAHLKAWMKTRRIPTALHYLPAVNRL
ncbi:MAG: hypothetical protein ACTHKB_08165, partial [Burkholderiaceae bacterium]